jgi:hypothetical protein
MYMGLPWCLQLEIVIMEKKDTVRVSTARNADRQEKIKVYRMRNFPPLCKLRARRDRKLRIKLWKIGLQELIRGLIVTNAKAPEDVR